VNERANGENLQEPARVWWRIDSPYGVLAILAFMNFINYVDRAVVPPLIPFLESPVAEGGLALTKTQLGLIGGAFMVVHSLASLPLGLLADRISRRWVIAAGVSLWSVATAAAGLARSFAHLFVARAAVGIGEAAYAPAATALISERFKPSARARAMGIFQIGTFLGGAVAVILGGAIAIKWGWRAAFLVVGGPGIVLSLLILLVRENPPAARRKADPHGLEGTARPSGSIAIPIGAPGSLWTAAWITAVGVLNTFFIQAFIFWGPAFILAQHYGGNKKLMAKVTTPFGLVALVAGLLGVLGGSWIADWLERRRPGQGRLLTIALGVTCSAPCAVFGLFAPNVTLLYLALAPGVFFAVWYVGPILAALHDVVPPHRRATATGAYLMCVHLLGSAAGPFVAGWIGDQPWGSLRLGLLATIAVMGLAVPAALLAAAGSRRVARLKHPGSTG
jgi:MFS transporter, Spinster family, sphingosine-1-phosphate transporter